MKYSGYKVSGHRHACRTQNTISPAPFKRQLRHKKQMCIRQCNLSAIGSQNLLKINHQFFQLSILVIQLDPKISWILNLRHTHRNVTIQVGRQTLRCVHYARYDCIAGQSQVHLHIMTMCTQSTHKILIHSLSSTTQSMTIMVTNCRNCFYMKRPHHTICYTHSLQYVVYRHFMWDNSTLCTLSPLLILCIKMFHIYPSTDRINTLILKYTNCTPWNKWN